MQETRCPFCMKTVQTEICPFCGNPVNHSGHLTHLPVGYTLYGRKIYVLGAALGQGGFGITYIALDVENNQRVAIKEYYPNHCCSRGNSAVVHSGYGQEETYSKGKQHFILEAQMLQSLSDLDSVVKVLDYFEANNSAYLVMEYLDGLSLKEYVERNGKLPPQQFLNQMKPLMADMEKMHRRGVVHRDIAPDNIILLPDGRLKLIDFGAARSYVGDKSMTVVVKKGFAPVEQYMRKGSNASTDVYALAATIYYCITGIVPPDSAERQYGEAELQAPTSLGVELSREQEQALEKALEIQPKERIQSVAELAKALDQAPKPVKPKAEKPKTIPLSNQAKPVQTVSKKKVKWWIPMAAAVAVLCIGAGLLFAGKGAPSASEESAQMEAAQTLPVETEKVLQLSAEARAYNEAVDLFKNEEYGKAAIAFGKLGDYRDAREISFKIWDAIANRNTFDTFGAVREDGTVIALDYDVDGWTNIIAINGWYGGFVGLKADGTVLIRDEEHGNWTVEEDGWSDIVAIDEGYYYTYIDSEYCAFSGLIGLKADGTLVVLNSYEVYGDPYKNRDVDSECIFLEKLATIRDVVMVDGNTITTADGTIYQNLEILEEQDVSNRVYLRDNGTVNYPEPIFGDYTSYSDRVLKKQIYTDVSTWENIADFQSGPGGVVGLKTDGTMISAGKFYGKENFFSDWTEILTFRVGWAHRGRGGPGGYTLGLKSDGTVVACGSDEGVCREAESWTNIKLPADRDALLAAIKLDYITE